MTELPPYTGKPSQPQPVADEPAQPAFPVVYAPTSVVWDSRILLIGVAAFAAITAILTIIGGLGFPGGPIEGIYWIGLIFDLVAVAIVVTVFAVVDHTRRLAPGRLGLPVNTRRSVFAIIALALAVVTVFAWVVGGATEQTVMLLQGVRTRYMYATGGVFAAGLPWALAAIFGSWGYRPLGNRVTNVLAIIAVVIWAALAALTTAHALVYGAGLSD